MPYCYTDAGIRFYKPIEWNGVQYEELVYQNQSLVSEDGKLVICSKNSAKIQTLNLKSYEVVDMESFNEPLLQFVKVGNYKFVALESGLYVL